MNAILNQIVPILEFIAPVFPYAGVILASLVISGIGTQALKWCWKMYKKHHKVKLNGVGEMYETIVLEVLAFVLALIPCAAMWPGPHTAWAAITVGIASPILYKITVGYAYSVKPELREWLSAQGG